MWSCGVWSASVGGHGVCVVLPAQGAAVSRRLPWRARSTGAKQRQQLLAPRLHSQLMVTALCPQDWCQEPRARDHGARGVRETTSALCLEALLLPTWLIVEQPPRETTSALCLKALLLPTWLIVEQPPRETTSALCLEALLLPTWLIVEQPPPSAAHTCSSRVWKRVNEAPTRRSISCLASTASDSCLLGTPARANEGWRETTLDAQQVSVKLRPHASGKCSLGTSDPTKGGSIRGEWCCRSRGWCQLGMGRSSRRRVKGRWETWCSRV